MTNEHCAECIDACHRLASLVCLFVCECVSRECLLISGVYMFTLSLVTLHQLIYIELTCATVIELVENSAFLSLSCLSVERSHVGGQ